MKHGEVDTEQVLGVATLFYTAAEGRQQATQPFSKFKLLSASALKVKSVLHFLQDKVSARRTPQCLLRLGSARVAQTLPAVLPCFSPSWQGTFTNLFYFAFVCCWI